MREDRIWLLQAGSSLSKEATAKETFQFPFRSIESSFIYCVMRVCSVLPRKKRKQKFKVKTIFRKKGQIHMGCIKKRHENLVEGVWIL